MSILFRLRTGKTSWEPNVTIMVATEAIRSIFLSFLSTCETMQCLGETALYMGPFFRDSLHQIRQLSHVIVSIDCLAFIKVVHERHFKCMPKYGHHNFAECCVRRLLFISFLCRFDYGV